METNCSVFVADVTYGLSIAIPKKSAIRLYPREMDGHFILSFWGGILTLVDNLVLDEKIPPRGRGEGGISPHFFEL